ncbi:MAG: hypothetical protein WB785_13995 [Mycobacterium sp.]|uniref:hypothetical protein n=1 Tax=Mycobacterium sp. TaxID=1785 RepID=UPI003C36C580
MVDRPFAKVVASLNRLKWLSDEQERAESTARLITARDLALAGAATIRVDFEALRATPAVVIRRLADELGLEATEAQIDAATDSVLKPADVPSDVDPYQRFIDRLLPEVTHNPKDARSVSLLAQAYFDSGDFANARKWFAWKIEIGGRPDEEIFVAMLRVAQSMEQLDEPWLDVQDAYLRAWEFRPTRAEPLYGVALHYRGEKRYQLGYLFAARAAETVLPDEDMIVPYPDIYAWRAADERAVCAYRIGRHTEAFMVWRRLLARPDVPHDDRQRIAINRDLGVPTMAEAVSSYPDALVNRLTAQPGSAEVVVSLVAGPDRAATERSLNSFLHCCTDVARVGRFVVLDTGLSTQDRDILQKHYGFLEFSTCTSGAQLAQLREHIDGRYWLHLGQGWRFFAPENFITRLTAVLEAEPQVFQVGINFADAVELTRTCAAEQMVHRGPEAGRYLLTDVVAGGPAMFDTARLDNAGGVRGSDADPIAELARRAAAAGLRTASLDEVLCVAAGS